MYVGLGKLNNVDHNSPIFIDTISILSMPRKPIVLLRMRVIGKISRVVVLFFPTVLLQVKVSPFFFKPPVSAKVHSDRFGRCLIADVYIDCRSLPSCVLMVLILIILLSIVMSLVLLGPLSVILLSWEGISISFIYHDFISDLPDFT